MLDATLQDRIEYLESNIEEVHQKRRRLEGKSSFIAKEQDAELRVLEQKMRSELNEIRPYAVIEDNSKFYVTHKGMFVTDVFRKAVFFETWGQADQYISVMREAEAA